ncbi:LacI family DNA-binding transcriptional regulator [Pseudoduganella namucuonensis]|uniref:Transcriptional regulator, LacI family n=1 Tax=Pseudoduganella namucuonensis TaxID=1035707 RepID=A0A1I7LZC5_9BURK|nr:LacI family DNA-binding transcriptional regulator [Pseudoduganella namucuonensis]SFV15062.1 transcriptional regulator, LacI family [Pseudoduganella namucuonensis]
MVAVADVARHAGVSTATVSRVLNNHASVRGETRERVLRAISALDYRVDVSARSLRTAQTRLILVLLPDLGNSYYASIVRGISAVARSHDYEVLVCETVVNEARERAHVQMLSSRLYDGVICMDPYTTQRLVAEEVKGQPWVACSEFVPGDQVPHVSIDHYLAAKDAVLYLLSKGRRRIALINSDSRYLYAGQRLNGYLDALRAADIGEREGYIQNTGGVDYYLGELAARRMLAGADRPDAILAVSDTLAIGAIKAVVAAGLAVPDDIAVIGFDDIPFAGIFEPPLTTIGQPRELLGERAMHLLLQRMAGQSPASETLPHRLVIRQSA